MANNPPLLKEKDKKEKAHKIGWWQKRCDELLTPIVRKEHPRCEACGQETQVAHHFIEKSHSAKLRYDFGNLIALCHSCHAKIHNRFGNSISGSLDVANIIIGKRGEIWYETLKRVGREQIRVNIGYYKEKLVELKNRLSTGQTFT
jgi:hypothetical protein